MSAEPAMLRVCDLGHHPVDDRAAPVQLAKRQEFLRQFEPRSLRLKRFKLRTTFASSSERPEPRYLGFKLSSIVVLTMLACVLIAVAMIAWAPIDTGIIVLVTIIAFLSIAVFHSHFRHRGSANLTAMSALAEGICASCAFSLQGLEPEEDGCLVCPECGHAWKALRIVRPHWEPEPDNVIPKRDPRLDLRHSIGLFYVSGFVPDDCGRLARSHTSRLFRLDPAIRSQRSEGEWKRISSEIRRIGRLRRIFASLLLFTLMAFIAVRWSIPALFDDAGAFMTSLLVMAFPALAAILTLVGDAWIGDRRMAHALNAHGLCGGCCNDMTKTPANAVSMRVCGRCRSSWLDQRFPASSVGGRRAVTETPPAP